MASQPFFVAEDFLSAANLPDDNALTLLAPTSNVVIKTISFANNTTSVVGCEILVNDIHFTDVTIPPYSGYQDAGEMVRRFEIFEEGVFPGAFNNKGVGYFGLKSGDTIKVKLYSTPGGGDVINVVATGSNT